MNIKKILKPAVILCIICTFTTAALAVTNFVTKDKIEELNIKKEQETIEQIITADEYEAGTVQFNNQDYKYYSAKVGGATVAYVFKTSAKGYGGDITVMTGIDLEGNIISVKVTDVSSETPGLGQNVAKSDFTDKFSGFNGLVGLDGTTNNTVDAVTGATYSSRAVINSVNTAINIYETVKEG